MAAKHSKRSKYEDYDNERKDKRQKIIKKTLLAFAIVIGVLAAILILEHFGGFPGSILNRFPLSSYLNEQYGGGEISYSHYDSESDNYMYHCTVEGKPCDFAVKGFKVRTDGYYQAYGRNTHFETVVETYLSEFLNKKWAESDAGWEASWACEIDLPLSNAEYPSAPETGNGDDLLIQNALKTYGSSLRFTVNLHGESLSMEDFQGVVYRALRILQQELDNRPERMQLFYYRKDGADERMQYEAALQSFQFDYNEAGLRNASDVFKYVEIPSELQKKANIYYTVKLIFLIVLAATILTLSILWGVRRYRKQKRYKDSGSKSE